MEKQARTEEKKFQNVRVRKDIFDTIGRHCYATNQSLARAIEEALERYIEDEGLEVVQ